MVVQRKEISRDDQKQKKRYFIKAIDIWQYLYFIMVFSMSFAVEEYNFALFALQFVLALPFLNTTEKYLEICMVFSTIAYFFKGADEAVFSIYTIYIGFLVFHFVMNPKINFARNLLLRLLLIAIFLYSYKLSTLALSTGLYELIYVVGMSILISFMVEVDRKEPLKRLPNLCMCGILLYAVALLLHPVIREGRYTFSDDVNVNTLGLSVAVMTTMVLIDLFHDAEGKLKFARYSVALLGLTLLLLTGSRNGLMALGGTVILFLIVKGWENKRFLRALFGVAFLLLLVGLVYYFAVKSGMIEDSSRLSLEKIVSSGGTNRVHVWTEIIPYVYRNNFLWGLGPGKYGTHVVLLKLVQRSYSHAHNTLVEAFVEVGVIGLSCMALLLICVAKQAITLLKYDKNACRLVCFFVCLMIASIGESYFNDIVLWLPIGVISIHWKKAPQKDSEQENRR